MIMILPDACLALLSRLLNYLHLSGTGQWPVGQIRERERKLFFMEEKVEEEVYFIRQESVYPGHRQW